MYKRALLGLGLGVFMTSAVTAAPNNASGASARPVSVRGTHVHRGEKKSMRSTGWASAYRSDEMVAKLKTALDPSSESKSTASGPSSPSSPSSSSKTTGTTIRSSEEGYRGYYGSGRESAQRTDSGPTVRVVTSAGDTGLGKHPIRPAVFGGAKGGTSDQDLVLKRLGRLIAQQGWPLLTGGGNGNPKVAQKAAFEAGGYTVGFAQAESLSDHRTSGRPADHLSVLYTTGTGRGVGTIEREAPLAEQANIGIFAGGSIGTLGELVASLYKPGVLAFLKGSGGVADAAVKKILPYIGKLPSHVRVVESSDPEDLLISAMVELDKLGPAAKSFPQKTVKVGERAVFKDPEAVRKNTNVITYLVDSQGMSAGDIKNVKALSARLHDETIEGKESAVVVPDRGGLTEEIAQQAVKSGTPTFAISHLGPRRNVSTDGQPHRIFLDKGEGVGESATGREVTQDARVVVVAGGDYKSLSGLIYALHRDTVIAVLETGGMSGKLREEIMPVISDKASKAKIVYSADPDRLFGLIKTALAPPPPPPPAPKIVISRDRDESGPSRRSPSFDHGYDSFNDYNEGWE